VPYKQLGHWLPAIEEPTLTNIARGLFPALPAVDWDSVPLEPSVPTVILEQSEVLIPPFTVDELRSVARKLSSGKARVTLDIKNAFNTAPWKLIDESLQRSSVPEYLIRILRSYMSDCKFLVETLPRKDKALQ